MQQMHKKSPKTEGKVVKMIEVGRVCLKVVGRDSNLKCTVVDIIDNKTVLIDGQTRRRKCNIKHVEPLNQVLNIKKGATHSEVVKELEKIGIKVAEKKEKAKSKTQKPIRKRKAKAKESNVEKTKKKAKRK